MNKRWGYRVKVWFFIAVLLIGLLPGPAVMAHGRDSDQTPAVGILRAYLNQEPYLVGDVLRLQVDFNRPIYCDIEDGTPYIEIALAIGTRKVYCRPITNIDNMASLPFEYKVQLGDSAPNGITVGKQIFLNGGSIKDSEDVDVNPVITNNLNFDQVRIDTSCPLIAQIGYAPYTPTESFNVNFNQDVTTGPEFNQITIRDENGGLISISPSLNSNRAIKVYPKGCQWKPSMHYTLTIPAKAILDMTGSCLSSELVFNYLTPSYAPYASTRFNESGADNSPRNPTIVINYDQNIYKSDNYNNVVFADSDGNTVNANKSILQYRLIVSPKTKLKANTNYTLTVPYNAVKGKLINAPNEVFTVKFKTGS